MSTPLGFDFPIQPPPHLLDRIHRTRSAIEGERKQVTVLFADVGGSTSLIAGVDPEHAAELLEPALRAMMDTVHRFEGTVNRVHGDGIMALFGAPLAQEHHAVFACWAALEIPAAVRRATAERIGVRVGLDSGEVLVHSIGNDMSMDYDATGETVHLASRMEKLASLDRAAITENTMRLAAGFVEAVSLGEQQIKGIAEPVLAYELAQRIPQIRSTWQVRASRGLIRFLGRDAEMSRLNAAFDDARAGRGQVVSVCGTPGVGKSRLIHEFLSKIEGPATILQAEGLPHRRTAAYLPVIALLRTRIAAGEGDTKEEIGEKLDRAAAAITSDPDHVLPPLRALLDLPTDPAWKRLDAAQRRQWTLRALVAFLSGSARDALTVVVIEDLQWVDSETQTVIERLASALDELPILLLVTHRMKHARGLPASAPHTRIALEPLDPPIAKALLRALLGDDPTLDPLKRLILERTSGVPLFLEETVRTLRETGALSGTTGHHRLVADVRSIEIPATVRDVLAERIDRLRPGAKSLLQVAAAIGAPVPVELLRAVTGFSAEEADEHLEELEEADFVFALPQLHTREYDFRHLLIQEVAYNGMLRSEQRKLHGTIVTEIEKLYADRLDEQVDRLADHAYRAERWEQTAEYGLKACIRAVGRSAMREGLGIFERSIEALGHLPQTPEFLRAGVDLRLVAGNALVPLGEQDALVRLLNEAEEQAQALGDARRVGIVYSQLTTALWMTADYPRGLLTGQRALDVALELGNTPLELAARFGISMEHYGLGNHQEAIAIQQRLLEELRPELERERLGWAGYPVVLIRSFLVDSLIDLGHFDHALRVAREGMALAEQIGHTYSSAMMSMVQGRLLTELGRAREAVDVLEPMLEACREEEIRTMVPPVAGWLAWAYTHSGEHERAIQTSRSALRPEIRRYGAQCTALYLFVAAGTAHLNAGGLDEALEMGREAELLTARTQDASNRARALKLIGDALVALRGDELGAAEAAYTEAIGLAREREMRPLVAQLHRNRGELFAMGRRWGEAESELALALEGFEAVGLKERSADTVAARERVRRRQSS